MEGGEPHRTGMIWFRALALPPPSPPPTALPFSATGWFLPQSLTKVNREEGGGKECSVSMATLRAADVLSDVSVTSAGRKGSQEKQQGGRPLQHTPGRGAGSGTRCGPGWGRRGPEGSGTPRGMADSRRAEGTPDMQRHMLLRQPSTCHPVFTPSGEKTPLGLPQLTPACPFPANASTGCSAQGHPQRLDPEPQGQRLVLSETEKPTGLHLWGVLGDTAASSVPPGLPHPTHPSFRPLEG